MLDLGCGQGLTSFAASRLVGAKGTGFPDAFPLDDHHLLITNKPMLVCGNSGAMVGDTRFGKHFTVTGDKSVHYGSFDCS